MIQKEIQELKNILSVEALTAREMIERSMEGTVNSELPTLQVVLNVLEPQLNSLDKELEQKCIFTMARYSPEASDLRTVVSVLKANIDLERVGDLSVNICHSAIHVITLFGEVPAMKIIPSMSECVLEMLNNAVSSFMDRDPRKAHSVLKTDKVVNEMRKKGIKKLLILMRNEPENVDAYLKLNNIVNYLERIGDIATNIAEEAIYIAEGRDVKHEKDG